MKLSIKDFSSKFDQIRRKLRIWSHLLKKSLIENFIFCTVIIILWGWHLKGWGAAICKSIFAKKKFPEFLELQLQIYQIFTKFYQI